MTRRPAVLVFAGLDPSGRAGLLADAEAIAQAGAQPLCLATALTVQSARRSVRFVPVELPLLREAAELLLSEEPVAAIKLGMLGTPALAAGVANLAAAARLPLVVDPVLAASSGARLFAGTAPQWWGALGPALKAAILTPNLAEAAWLLGEERPPADLAAMERAGRALLAKGVRAVLIKGGHLRGDASPDLLIEASAATLLAGPRISGEARGTGCRLASAVAAQLALGVPLPSAARAAKEAVAAYVARCAVVDSAPS